MVLIKNEKAVSYLLHLDEPKSVPFWHTPFHFFGIGPIPSSLKLFESGHTPIFRWRKKNTLMTCLSCKHTNTLLTVVVIIT
jgi:hypothetical protein